MDGAIKNFCEELEKVSIKDATKMLIGMLSGPRMHEDSDMAREFAEASIALANVGMVAVFAKSKIVPLLLEGATPNDDTALEDDLLITNR